MRYLVNMYESIISESDWINYVKDFCEMNLAYLMDDGLKVRVVAHYTNEQQQIDWHKTKLCYVVLSYSDLDVKHWDDIKDLIIPFFTRLSRQFTVPYFDHLPTITSDRISKGLPPVPQTLIGHQVQFALIGLDNKFRRNFSIKELDGDVGVRLSSNTSSVSTISFYVSERPLYNELDKKDGFGKRIRKFLGFDDLSSNR